MTKIKEKKEYTVEDNVPVGHLIGSAADVYADQYQVVLDMKEGKTHIQGPSIKFPKSEYKAFKSCAASIRYQIPARRFRFCRVDKYHYRIWRIKDNSVLKKRRTK